MTMLFDWFNAREAVEVGTSLADHFLILPEEGSSTPGRRKSGQSGQRRGDLQKFFQRAAREAGALKLNLFQRAKLLNSFKWRLLEHGYDRGRADEITQTLLLQLQNSRAGATLTAGRDAAAPAKGGLSKRIPLLITEADAHFAKGEHDETVKRLQEALGIDPDHALAHSKLGAVFYHLGRYEEAERELRRAIELKGELAEAHFNLGNLLYRKGDFGYAEAAQRRALQLDPKNTETLVSRGMALARCLRFDDARGCFEKALRLEPRNAGALCELGWLARVAGRFEEAEKLYRTALEIDPRKPAALQGLVGLRRMTPADAAWLEDMKRLIAAGVPPVEETGLQFALGKYFDDVGSFSEAFAHYKRANEMQRLVARPYDRAARTRLIDDRARVYTRERVAQSAEGASDSSRPVFVVGMMRSGTTLAEQIIVSHPQAASAGELDFWLEAARKHQDVLRRALPDAPLAKELVDSYLKTLAQHSADALRVVDKSTFNSDHLGLIHALFPKARIIYLWRDPVDICLSCYFQYFPNASNLSFTMDLSDLVHYYRGHHRLIGHWRSVLPPEALLVVPYAELVRDQEAWSRRMIEFIGLEWDPRCLEFHKAKRPVSNSSSWQVRQPLYSSSIERWRNYKKHIGPLLKLRELKSP